MHSTKFCPNVGFVHVKSTLDHIDPKRSSTKQRGLRQVNRYRPRMDVHSTVDPISVAFLADSFSGLTQPDVINIYRTRTTGRCAAFSTQADGDFIHVGQIDPLIGKGL